MNDTDRPVFVNHYYAGEPPIQFTSKRLIKLDECDELSTDSSRSYKIPMGNQPRAPNHESVELSQDSLGMPMSTKNAGPTLLQKE